VKFLGLANRTHGPVAPDVPATAELGLPDLVASAWFAALKLPEMRTRFLDVGAERQGGTPAQTAAFIKGEEARWRGVIKSANVTLE
jgi:tripartite-type tricarboxylate transporter receptor subunit TctC